MNRDIPIIVTTSDRYHHLLKIFIYLFNKNWSDKQQVTIIGYDKPDFELPQNFTFHSLGKQSNTNKDFSNDLRPYFESLQSEWVTWFFEDSFIKSVDLGKLNLTLDLTTIDNVGRINLTYASRLQEHISFQHFYGVYDYKILENTQTARYRICTQPSIWNVKFLLQYLKPNMSPWDFESQDPKNDGWRILGLEQGCIQHNEGVTRHDIYKYDLSGIKIEQIEEMEKLGLLKEATYQY